MAVFKFPANGIIWLLVSLFFCCNSYHSFAQPSNRALDIKKTSGVPFLRNYSPDEYNANGQNWAILQDQNGIMYFGNSDGVLEYDGVTWRLIQTKNKSVVRSLAIDSNNRIYIGAYGEIGYLSPDAAGRLQYQSLLPHLDKQYLGFPDVWQTISTSDGVYFVTPKYIFRWANEQMHIFEAKTTFHVGFGVNDKFYVRQREIGLMEVVSDSLRLVPEGDKFSTERIYAILPFSGPGSGDKTKNQMLLGTRSGLLLYDGTVVKPFPNAVDNMLKDAQLYHGAKLPNGNYAFATIQNGVFVVDGKGALVHHLNKATGLQDNTVWFLYSDRQEGLWIGMDVGISRVEIEAPLTQFTGLKGMEGNVHDIVQYHGSLFVSTSLGTYYLDETGANSKVVGDAGRFRRMEGIPPQCWALLTVGESLLVGSFEGIYEVRGQAVRLVNKAYTFTLHRSKLDTNRIYAGLQNGIMSLYHSNGQWLEEGRIDSVNLEIRNILETPDKKLWLTTRYQGLLRLDFSAGFSLQPRITQFDTLQGLPPGDRNIAFLTKQGLRFGTQKGIYRFEETQQRFVADSLLIKGFPQNQRQVFSVAKDHLGNLWLVEGDNSNLGIALLQPDGSYVWEEKPLLRIAGMDIYFAYPDRLRKGVIWLGGVDRVIQYDAAVTKNYVSDFKTLVRQVIVNGDSIIFFGAITGNPVKLSYANNSLRFVYGAPSFDDESKTEYQYLLEGYDEHWSKWTTETHKDYTKLPAGNYRFLVRAKNIYQHLGSTASFEFKILPPFYLTRWAFLLYAILVIGAGLTLRRYEIERLKRKQVQELEHLELNKLKELDSLKSRFFADISHEFRTPLTVISGMADMIKEQPAKAKELISKNSEGLLRLVNQMLDLAKLESGQMKLELSQADVVPYVQYLSESFQSLAAKRNIKLVFSKEVDQLMMDFDEKKLESIVFNLLHNAIKFSKENGKINVHLRQENGQLLLKVKDNGIGIPTNKLPFIFDRFYQVEDTVGATSSRSTNSTGGTGIGLALTKELVELMGGEITVKSNSPAVGELGTEFTVSLPIRQNAPVAVTDATAHMVTPAFSTTNEELSSDGFEPAEREDLPLLLLIEDNDDVAFYIQASLQGRYAVLRAANGAIGIEKALEIIPDVIISDVMMPEKDGFEVCQTLKNDERTCHVPIVLLTAKADVQSRLEGLGVGADAYLSKPFLKEELFIRLEKLVALRKRLQEKYAGKDFIALAAEATIPAMQSLDDAFLKKATNAILDHLDDALYGNEELAQAMTMSESQLNRKVKALTGKTLSIFIRSIRLQQGKILLQTTAMNISEIAYAVGFTDPFYFSRTFSQEFGLAPSKLRN